jgi:hypothetical protein
MTISGYFRAGSKCVRCVRRVRAGKLPLLIFHYFENIDNISIGVPTGKCCELVFGYIGPAGAKMGAF